MCDPIGGTWLCHDHLVAEASDCAEAYLIATPEGLVEVFNAVDKALSSPKGCASVELMTPNGESFTLHIVCCFE